MRVQASRFLELRPLISVVAAVAILRMLYTCISSACRVDNLEISISLGSPQRALSGSRFFSEPGQMTRSTRLWNATSPTLWRQSEHRVVSSNAMANPNGLPALAQPTECGPQNVHTRRSLGDIDRVSQDTDDQLNDSRIPSYLRQRKVHGEDLHEIHSSTLPVSELFTGLTVPRREFSNRQASATRSVLANGGKATLDARTNILAIPAGCDSCWLWYCDDSNQFANVKS